VNAIGVMNGVARLLATDRVQLAVGPEETWSSSRSLQAEFEVQPRPLAAILVAALRAMIRRFD